MARGRKAFNALVYVIYKSKSVYAVSNQLAVVFISEDRYDSKLVMRPK